MYHSVTKEDSLDDIWRIGSTSFTDHLTYFCGDKDINLYDNGSPYRDVMHIKDVCRAIKLVIDSGELNTIYNMYDY